LRSFGFQVLSLAGCGNLGPNDSRFGSGNVSDISSYIKLGPLGRAFQAQERHVLLIDEIDKADLEFPNDLLLELDRADHVEQREGASRRLQLDQHLIEQLRAEEVAAEDVRMRAALRLQAVRDEEEVAFPSPLICSLGHRRVGRWRGPKSSDRHSISNCFPSFTRLYCGKNSARALIV
jgi:hypothetical protein